jgi:TIR domain-containing protein
MPDCFISYTTKDKAFASAVHRDLSVHGLDVFMAAISLRPGDRWTPKIFANLDASSWVILLASRAACSSGYVQQEVGRVLGGPKKLIPVVWDMEPRDLPGWLNQYHALDVRGMTPAQIQDRIVAIAKTIKQDRNQGFVIAAGLIAGLFFLGSRSK